MRRILLTGLFAAMLVGTGLPTSAGRAENLPFYGRSYAVVVGVGRYPSSQWKDLAYARKDAQGMAGLLRRQGFEVIDLYDEKATRKAIVSVFEDYLAPRLSKHDRVLVFFSGHGDTQTLGGKDFGYLVPHDATGSRGSMISMETLRNLSDKMGAAKHHLFVIDACFGGLFAPTRARTDGIPKTHPRYIRDVTSRVARQFLTAGGKGQQVLDGGPSGYSYFTGYLIEALEKGFGDLDGDGYITLAELAGYLVPRATNDYQTPGDGTLPGHGLGQFVFAAPKGVRTSSTVAASPGNAPALGLKGSSASPVNQETLFWQTIKDSGNAADYRAYLQQFPNGVFAGLARNRVGKPSATLPATETVERETASEEASLAPPPDKRVGSIPSFGALLEENPGDLMRELGGYLREKVNIIGATFEVSQIWSHRPAEQVPDEFRGRSEAAGDGGAPNAKDQGVAIDAVCINFDLHLGRNETGNRDGCFLYRMEGGRITFLEHWNLNL